MCIVEDIKQTTIAVQDAPLPGAWDEAGKPFSASISDRKAFDFTPVSRMTKQQLC